MWPFKKKDKRILRTIYKVSYVTGAFIDDNKVTFDLNCLQDIFIDAVDMVSAQVEFAKKTALSPHVYVHKIEKVLDIEA